MHATFSRRCLGLLLLPLLLCTSVSGGSTADPAMTTQDSTQTQLNSVTKTQPGHESSGSDLATRELKPSSNQNMNDTLEHVIVLPGMSQKTVSLASPGKVELTCKLDENSDLKNPQVTWRKGSDTISHTSKTQNSWSSQLTISESSQLGSYTCTLKGEKEISATFNLQVPNVEGTEKPIITYERDKAVMVCKTEYNPKTWTWYVTNGTELVQISKILRSDKFQIRTPSASANRLEIFKVAKEDSGIYWCEATFELGASKARFELKVLSFATPLKPFTAIVIEVAVLLTAIVLYEVCSKRRGKSKSEDNTAGRRKSG